MSALLLDDALKPATPLTNGAINQTLWQFALLSAPELSWIVNIDKPSMKKLPPNSIIDGILVRAVWKPHVRLNNVDHAIDHCHCRLECDVWHFTR